MQARSEVQFIANYSETVFSTSKCSVYFLCWYRICFAIKCFNCIELCECKMCISKKVLVLFGQLSTRVAS